MPELGPFDGFVCPRCKYELRGLMSSACPECGSPLDVVDLRNHDIAGSVDARAAKWLAVAACVLLACTLGTAVSLPGDLDPAERVFSLGLFFRLFGLLLVLAQLILLLVSIFYGLMSLTVRNHRVLYLCSLAIVLCFTGLWTGLHLMTHFLADA